MIVSNFEFSVIQFISVGLTPIDYNRSDKINNITMIIIFVESVQNLTAFFKNNASSINNIHSYSHTHTHTYEPEYIQQQ